MGNPFWKWSQCGPKRENVDSSKMRREAKMGSESLRSLRGGEAGRGSPSPV